MMILGVMLLERLEKGLDVRSISLTSLGFDQPFGWKETMMPLGKRHELQS
jgi:hypothetical protein